MRTLKSKRRNSRNARASIGAMPMGVSSLARSPGSVPSSPCYSEQVKRDMPFNLAAFDSGKHAVDVEGRRGGNFSAAKEFISGNARLRRRRQTYTGPPAGSLQEPAEGFSARRPSSSWIRRLSIMSTKTEDQLLSPGLISPSINGSSTPTSPLSPNQYRESNKLVKRSTSQHLISGRPHSSRATFGGSVLRRPATSHQRSAHLRHQSIASGELGSTNNYGNSHSELRQDVIAERAEVTWRPYFSSFPDRTFERHTTKSSPRRRQDHTIRRIVADSDLSPTLLLASSMIHPDQTVGLENGRCRSSSHPPLFINPFQSSETPPGNIVSPTVQEKRKSRQSFTFSSFTTGGSLASWASLRRSSLRRGRGGSLSQGEMRNYSTLLERHPEAVRPGTAALPHRRKEVMDPSLFQRPVTMSQVVPPPFNAAGFSEPPGTSSSHIPPDALSRPIVDASQEIFLEPSDSPTETGASQQTFEPVEPSLPNVQQSHAQRHSSAASEPPSTVIGSDDRVFTSGEEDETDFQSETAYDSFRTHDTTSTTSCIRGPRIETIFDECSSTKQTNGKLTQLADTVPCAPFSARLPKQFPGISESDPIHISPTSPFDEKASVFSVREFSGHRSTSSTGSSQDESSPSMKLLLQDKSRYRSLSNGTKHSEVSTLPVDKVRLSSASYSTASTQDSCRKPTKKRSDLGTKVSLFDWSEQTWHDRDLQDVDFRPRTVHGKQGDARGSRSTGRKGPHALHLRSQSVPVSRELALASDTRQSSVKFGTWGLGSKGVTEDWDGDFEFDDSDGQSINDDDKAITVNRHRGMKVPKAIMDRQASVQGQFGQVQELTLLVEELKRLRLQANVLQIVQGPANDLWKEAEGIINLATLDEDDNVCISDTPPSTSYGFDNLDIDEVANSGSDIPLSLRSGPTTISLSTSQPCRFSKDSSKAKSILETIYQQRGPPELFSGDGQPRKLPFDTQSLRDLVARAGAVTRALKDTIREAEGVAVASENRRPLNPPFSRIFDQSLPQFSHIHRVELVERT